MAGKHQIFSSKKSTRQKANRSWRRTAKQQTPKSKPAKERTLKVREPQQQVTTTRYDEKLPNPVLTSFGLKPKATDKNIEG